MLHIFIQFFKLLNFPFENNENKYKQKVYELINERNSLPKDEFIYINDFETLYNIILNEINNIKRDHELREVINSITKINFEKDICLIHLFLLES